MKLGTLVCVRPRAGQYIAVLYDKECKRLTKIGHRSEIYGVVIGHHELDKNFCQLLTRYGISYTQSENLMVTSDA